MTVVNINDVKLSDEERQPCIKTTAAILSGKSTVLKVSTPPILTGFTIAAGSKAIRPQR